MRGKLYNIEVAQKEYDDLVKTLIEDFHEYTMEEVIDIMSDLKIMKVRLDFNKKYQGGKK